MIKKIGFQGIAGAYSELAVKSYFQKDAKAIAYPSFGEVFQAVEKKKLHFGVVPLENSVAGSILENYDLLNRHNLFIKGEIKLRVRHCLVGLPEAKLAKIKEVYSHPQALAQCAGLFKAHPKMKQQPYYDTAAAAKNLLNMNSLKAAAISSEIAAERYGLKILRKGIEDIHTNTTRFAVICKAPKRLLNPKPKVHYKVSLVFTLKSIPGALHKALSIFAIRDIDLHKIESRPVAGKPWEYRFFVDCDSHINLEAMSNALRHLKEICHEVKLLGCYPAARAQ